MVQLYSDMPAKQEQVKIVLRDHLNWSCQASGCVRIAGAFLIV